MLAEESEGGFRHVIPGMGFYRGDSVFKACVFPASSLESISDQIAFNFCRITSPAFAEEVI